MTNSQTKESNMSDDNTKPEFFALWSLRDLQVECARLNQLLNDVIEIAENIGIGLKNEN
jgi:hypothetical protein